MINSSQQGGQAEVSAQMERQRQSNQRQRQPRGDSGGGNYRGSGEGLSNPRGERVHRNRSGEGLSKNNSDRRQQSRRLSDESGGSSGKENRRGSGDRSRQGSFEREGHDHRRGSWDAERLCSEGDDLMKVKNYKAALSAYQAATAKSPNSATFHCKEAACYEHMGQYSEMVRCARKAIAIEPQFTGGYLKLATAYIKMGDFETAVDAIESGLAKDGEDVDLNRLVLQDDNISDIMSKRRRHRLGKSVRASKEKKNWGEDEGIDHDLEDETVLTNDNETYVMSAVGGESYATGAKKKRTKRPQAYASKNDDDGTHVWSVAGRNDDDGTHVWSVAGRESEPSSRKKSSSKKPSLDPIQSERVLQQNVSPPPSKQQQPSKSRPDSGNNARPRNGGSSRNNGSSRDHNLQQQQQRPSSNRSNSGDRPQARSGGASRNSGPSRDQELQQQQRPSSNRSNSGDRPQARSGASSQNPGPTSDEQKQQEQWLNQQQNAYQQAQQQSKTLEPKPPAPSEPAKADAGGCGCVIS